MKKLIALTQYEVGQTFWYVLFLTLASMLVSWGFPAYRIMSDQASYIDASLTYSIFVFEGWLILALALFFFATVAYALWIWSKDWRGQGGFIYRLMMLPYSRMLVYASKFLTVFAMVLYFYGLVYFLAWGQIQIGNHLMPGFVDRSMDILSFLSLMAPRMALVPTYGLQYSLVMLLVCGIIAAAFTTVLLFEGLKPRSPLLAGLWAGGFIILCLVLLVAFFNIMFQIRVTFPEILWISNGLLLVFVLANLALAHVFLKKSVSI